MPFEATVAIHLDKADALAHALSRAGDEHLTRSDQLARLLFEADESVAPAVRVLEAGRWMEAQHGKVGSLVAKIREWEAAGRVPASVVILTSRLHPSHHDPWRAVQAAATAARLYRADDTEQFLALVNEWLGDPVFADALLRRLGEDQLVRELRTYQLLLAAPSEEARADQEALVTGLSGLLALTSAYGAPTFSVAGLAATADQAGQLAALAALVHVPVRYDTAFLVALVDEVAVPLTEKHLAGEALPAEMLFDIDRGVDARAVIFDAVAESPAAAYAVIAASDIDVLLTRSAGYADDGAALGELLVVASSHGAASSPAENAVAVERLVTASVRVGQLPPETLDRLGEVAAPWIGGFGADHFDGALENPLPSLDGQVARDFLEMANRSAQSAEYLRAATAAWAAGELAELAAMPVQPVAAYGAIGDIIGRVGDEYQQGAADRAQELDAERAADRAYWGIVASVATDRVPTPTSLAAGVVGDVALDALLPQTTQELDLLGDVSGNRTHDQIAAEYMTLSGLWASRADNGLFTEATVPPPALLDDGGHLRSPSSLGPDDLEMYSHWVGVDLAGTDVGEVVDHLGAAHGRTGEPYD